MQTYTINKKHRSSFHFPLPSKEWQRAGKAEISRFLPESSSHHPQTTVRLLYDQQGIYGLFQVHDRFVRCLHTRFQEAVYQDACVEFFVQPDGAPGYFNFEFNACGTLLASYVLNPQKDEKGFPKEFRPLTQDDLSRMKIRSTFKKPIVEETAEPIDWEVEFFISFDVLLRYIPEMKIAGRGSRWRGNFYKCAENNSHPHWAAWAPVPELNFHLPLYFGGFIFN